jgi:hypothetical protein
VRAPLLNICTSLFRSCRYAETVRTEAGDDFGLDVVSLKVSLMRIRARIRHAGLAGIAVSIPLSALPGGLLHGTCAITLQGWGCSSRYRVDFL